MIILELLYFANKKITELNLVDGMKVVPSTINFLASFNEIENNSVDNNSIFNLVFYPEIYNYGTQYNFLLKELTIGEIKNISNSLYDYYLPSKDKFYKTKEGSGNQDDSKVLKYTYDENDDSDLEIISQREYYNMISVLNNIKNGQMPDIDSTNINWIQHVFLYWTYKILNENTIDIHSRLETSDTISPIIEYISLYEQLYRLFPKYIKKLP